MNDQVGGLRTFTKTSFDTRCTVWEISGWIWVATQIPGCFQLLLGQWSDPSWLFSLKGLKPPTTLRSLLYPFVLIFWPRILLRFIPIDFMDNVTLKLNMSQQRGYALPFKYQSVVLVGADFCSLLYFRLYLMNLMTNIFLHLYSTRFICVRYIKPQRVCLFFVLSSLHQFIAW